MMRQTWSSFVVQVGDFGISAWQGLVLSSDQYCGVLPPEEASLPSSAYPGKPGDVYRFGYVPVEAMVVPHRYSPVGTIEDTFHDVTAVLPLPLPVGSWSSPELCQLVSQCLEQSPDQRPTFALIAAALEPIVATSPSIGS